MPLRLLEEVLSLGIHKGKTLVKGIMLLLKLSVFLVVELVFKRDLFCLAVCLQQSIYKGVYFLIGLLKVFPYLSSRAIILCKDTHFLHLPDMNM